MKLRMSLDIADVPALPDEDWMPPLNTVRWRVQFFNTSAKTLDEYWKDANQDWGSLMREILGTTGGLKKAAAAIVANASTDDQKLRNIYAAVMTLDNTDFTRTKSKAERKAHKIKEIHKIEDVLRVAANGTHNSVTVTRVLACNFVLLKATDYPDLHEFYQKVATADQEQLVLVKTPAAKGTGL